MMYSKLLLVDLPRNSFPSSLRGIITDPNAKLSSKAIRNTLQRMRIPIPSAAASWV